MPIGIAVFLFIVELAGIFFAFQVISKRKKAKQKTCAAVTVCIVFCLLAVISTLYMAFALLLIGNII